MKKLISFELEKMLRSKAAKIALILLVVVMAGLIIAEYQDVRAYNQNAEYRQELNDWRSREENVIKFANQSLNEDDWVSPFQREQIERRIAIAQYRLDNDIQKDVYKNVWWFFNDNSFNLMSSLVIVLTALLGSACLAGEYGKNTMRQVALLPYRRWKILTAKAAATALCGLGLYAILFLLGVLSGFLLHGADGLASRVVLYFGKTISTMNMSLYSLIVVLLKIADLVFYIVFTLFVAVFTRSAGASAIISGAAAVFSVPVCNFISDYYPVMNYLPFCNLDFRRFLDFGTVMPRIEPGWAAVVQPGISAPLAAAISGIFTLLLIFFSYRRFNRQEL